jgi:hypothetical protein
MPGGNTALGQTKLPPGSEHSTRKLDRRRAAKTKKLEFPGFSADC